MEDVEWIGPLTKIAQEFGGQAAFWGGIQVSLPIAQQSDNDEPGSKARVVVDVHDRLDPPW